MITVHATGDYHKATSYLERLREIVKLGQLDKYGRIGVKALKDATPKDTGKTADSWDYTIERTDNSVRIYWENSNVVDGYNIAVILQYGHGTRNGGYVVGRDYINPAIQPVFDEIANSAWKEIISL